MSVGDRPRCRWRSPAAATLALATSLAASLVAVSARADEASSVVAVAVIVADGAFLGHDLGISGPSSSAWAITETIVTAPQTAIFHGLLVLAATNTPDDDLDAVAIPFAGLSGALTGHGAASLFDPSPSRATFAIAMAVSFDAALTTAALSDLASGRSESTTRALLEIFCTTPIVAVGAVEIARGLPDRPAWIALTAWSTLLLGHAFGSLAFGHPPTPPNESRILRIAPARLAEGAWGATWSGAF